MLRGGWDHESCNSQTSPKSQNIKIQKTSPKIPKQIPTIPNNQKTSKKPKHPKQSQQIQTFPRFIRGGHFHGLVPS